MPFWDRDYCSDSIRSRRYMGPLDQPPWTKWLRRLVGEAAARASHFTQIPTCASADSLTHEIPGWLYPLAYVPSVNNNGDMLSTPPSHPRRLTWLCWITPKVTMPLKYLGGALLGLRLSADVFWCPWEFPSWFRNSVPKQLNLSQLVTHIFDEVFGCKKWFDH